VSPLGKALPAGVAILALAIIPVAVAEAQKPIRVGASLSQTGDLADVGQTQLRAYQLCIKHTNEKGGVLGRKLALVVEDDQSRPATAAAIYEKLITRDRVDAILGPARRQSPKPRPMSRRSGGWSWSRRQLA
jgi:branched-chain amino acid transport system substrate-binding protein